MVAKEKTEKRMYVTVAYRNSVRLRDPNTESSNTEAVTSSSVATMSR
jgi:hypothetical protein